MAEDVRGTRPDRGRRAVEVPTVGAVAQSTIDDRNRWPLTATEPVLAEILAEVVGFEEVTRDGPAHPAVSLGRAPAPTRIGSTTQGVFSDDMERMLPNGWTFTLGNEEYLASDGKDYEGVGIPPTVGVPVFTPAELAQHQDPALDVPWSS